MAKKKKVSKKRTSKPSNKNHLQAVLEAVLNNNTHPTADWILRKLKRKFRSLTIKAVFEDLRKLKEEGYIWELDAKNLVATGGAGELVTHFEIRQLPKGRDDDDCGHKK